MRCSRDLADMRLAIMQPYAFPYLGYFQLMHAADRFVLLDDVTFIKQGWIHRNRLLGPHGPIRFTLPIEGASSNRRICDLRLAEVPPWRDRWLRTIEQSYSRAPGFGTAWPVVEAVVRHPERRLAAWLEHSLHQIASVLGIRTPITTASAEHPSDGARGVERVLAICRREGASDYLNSEGGRSLYHPATFADHGVSLRFLEHTPLAYPQRGSTFVPRLSVIDVLLNTLPSERARLLEGYKIVPAMARDTDGPAG